MKKVDGSKGTQSPSTHRGEGRESMGSIGKKVKSKGSVPKRDEGDEDEDELPRSKAQVKGKAVDSPAGVKRNKGDQKSSTPKKDVSTLKQRIETGIEPAELPLPHTIKHDDASEVEGLTKMQRDMKAKLEGARFRWVSFFGVSTRSKQADWQMDQRATVLDSLD
jgi:ribosomal RNA-processing protein 8